MKKFINLSILIAGTVFIFLSCNKEENFPNQKKITSTEEIFVKEVTEPDIIKDFQSEVTTLKSGGNIVFDTNKIYEVGLSRTSPKVFVANQKGFDQSNQINYGLSMAMDNNGNFGKPMIVETEKLNENIRVINYYDDSYNLLLSFELDSNSKEIEVLFKQPPLKSTGQDVSDCIEDAYKNHGWVSVWAWVQTAFIPQTALAISAACIGANI